MTRDNKYDVSSKRGASVPRNKLMFNHGINLLPYTGAGSGITRALKFTPDIKFMNDEVLNEFVVTVERKDLKTTNAVNDRVNDRDARDKTLTNNTLQNDSFLKNDRVDRDSSLRVPYKILDKLQKNIIQFCNIPRSSREILEHIGYSYHPTHISKFIKPLLQMGYLEMTEPDKPNSKNQKYRKVGRRNLNRI